VIWESYHWKEPLLQSASWLRRVRLGPGTRESTLVRIEKELFIGFYTIRKLLDTLKVSDSTKGQSYNLEFSPNRKRVDYLNWHHVDECYDLETRRSETRNLRFLCNLFIHSFVFVVCGEGPLEGFFVASDKMMNQKVYYVSIDQVIHAFRLVGRDYPDEVHLLRDPKTGEFRGRVT